MGESPTTAEGGRTGGTARRLVHSRGAWLTAAGVLAVAGVALLLHSEGAGDGFATIDGSEGDWAYLAVFFLVAGDAVCALLPGETTLNAAATLAAEGVLDLTLVIVAGALGAIVGDTALYWIARIGSRYFGPKLERAKENANVAAALSFLGDSAPVLLVVGRYVPGLRFVVNATLGLSRYPFRRFIVWSALGGALWATYTSLLAYAVGTALSDFPLASVVISGAITTAALAAAYVVGRRRRRRRGAGEA